MCNIITVLEYSVFVYFPLSANFILSYAFLLLHIFLFNLNPWSISYKAGLMGINSLGILYLLKYFISPSFLKDSFAGYSILNWCGFFSFSILNILAHSLLVCKFLLRNLLIGLLGFLRLSSLDFLLIHYFFLLLLWLDNFKQPVFRFTDSFFCFIKSVVEPL